MSDTPIALRVQASTIPDYPAVTIESLAAWASTAAKLLNIAAQEIVELERDHIGAHRTSLMTIRFLEDRLAKCEDIAR